MTHSFHARLSTDGGDRPADTRLEAIAEGVKIAFGTHSGIFVRIPGPAERVLHLENGIACPWALLLEMPSAAHARYARAHDQHVEMRRRGIGLGGDRVHLVHDMALLPDSHPRSEEHTSELQSLMRISYAVFCLKKKPINQTINR